MAVYNVLAGDFFALYNDDPVTNPIGAPVVQTFVPRDSARNYKTVVDVRHGFNVGGVARSDRAIVNVSLSDTLILYQKGAKGHFQTCTHFLFFWHSTRKVFYEISTHNLTLNQTLLGITSKNLTHTLAVIDVASANIITNQLTTDTLSMNSNANFWTLNKYVSNIPLPTLTGPNAPTC